MAPAALLLGSVAMLAPGCDSACHKADAPGGERGPHHHEGRTTPNDATKDVAAFDVWSNADVVDLLTLETEGHRTRLLHSRSRDGGASFAPPSAVPVEVSGGVVPAHGRDGPQIAALGESLVVLWSTPGSDAWTGPIASATSSDGGMTWVPGPRLADDGGVEAHNYIDVAADGDGVFHAVWLDTRGGRRGLRASRSTDRGGTWSANDTVEEHTCECCWNTLLAAPTGPFVLFRDDSPRDMILARSEGASGWRRLGPVGAFRWEYAGCPHVGGALSATSDGSLQAMVWTGLDGSQGLYSLRSTDGGITWTHPAAVAGSAQARNSALASRGTMVEAVWDRRTPDSSDIISSVSTDAGATWSMPQAVWSTPLDTSPPRIVATGNAFLILWTEQSCAGSWHHTIKVVRSRFAEPPSVAG